MTNATMNAELQVGALVVDKAVVPTVEGVRMVVGFRDGKCLTSYVAPPPWLSATGRFFMAEPEGLSPAPRNLVAELEDLLDVASVPEDRSCEEAAPQRFSRWLDELERVAQEDVGPGLEADYCQRLSVVLPETERAWRQTSSANRAVCRDIIAADPALANHVEEITEEEIRLISTFLRLWERVLRLRRGSPSPEAYEDARRLRQQLLQWVQAVRSHERDLTRSLLEAYYRDRGGQG